MVRRLIDVALSFTALVLTSPLLALAAIGIRLSSPGPIIYRARRVGINGSIFSMYKLRTMHISHGHFSGPLTASNDPRVFRFGLWLRRLKIDELLQLINILKGEMSIIGPRPEAPEIVRDYYDSDDFETLSILPGLASPGSIYNYTHGERLLNGHNVQECYATQLLPIKLALDIVYIREASFIYDIRLVARSVWVILCTALGKNNFREPPEINKAVRLGLVQSFYTEEINPESLSHLN